jgi:hypothetical protein
MRNLKDLKLRKKTEAKVQEWLTDWLTMFVEQADGKEGNVYRADFANEDFFYFTDCNDILAKDPEGKAQETNPNIIRRKQRVHLQLLLKTLLGEKIGKKIKCTHCGYEDRYIGKMYNGHYVYCPKCHYLSLNGYLETIGKSTVEVLHMLTDEGVSHVEEMRKLAEKAQKQANNAK